MKNNYTPVIGLEIHAELKTNSKMFCGCKNDPFGAPGPNTHTCEVCLGMPGTLPVANKKAIDWTIKFGLAVNCKINLFSKFDRKHYFYPDLPKGYQISQYDLPFCYEGELAVEDSTIGITRAHLEEDTGKLLHQTVNGEKVSLVDFNRGGVPLLEIVSEPDLTSGPQAKAYAKKIRQILRYLDISNCDMDQGGMRLEANISLKPSSESKDFLPNYKVEVKNINSFRFLEQAINYEIERQTKILDGGETPTQETRGWDQAKNQTFSQRTKEEAADYRYFPDPDLPPFRFKPEEIEQLRSELPELPDEKIQRWVKDYQINLSAAQILSANPVKADWFDKLFTVSQKAKISPNDLANSIVNGKLKITVSENPESTLKQFAELIKTDSSDDSQIITIINHILAENPDTVNKFKQGKTQVIGFLIGQTIQQSGKKLDPKQVKLLIEKQLSN